MRMVRLIYYSHARPANTDEDVADIMQKSIRRNAGEDISGLLAYDATYFLQVLEGPPEAVNDLYRDLMSDPRHCSLRLVSYGEIAARKFQRWSMAIAYLPDFPGKYLKRTVGGFVPPRFSAELALEFLEILGDYLDETENR